MLIVESVDKTTVVHFEWPGIIDETEIARIGDQLLHLVETLAEAHIVLDLSSARGGGIPLLRVLADVHNQTKAAGGRLAMAGLTPELLKLLRLTGMDAVLHIYESEGEAIESLSLEPAPA
jgi:anti-anti-sigma factor